MMEIKNESERMMSRMAGLGSKRTLGAKRGVEAKRDDQRSFMIGGILLSHDCWF